MRRPRTSNRVVHVGPAPSAAGGISRAIERIMSSQLAGSYDMEWVSTLSASAGWTRHVAAVGGVLRAVLMALGPGRLVFHVHMSSRGSFWRKAVVVSAARIGRNGVVLHIHGSEFDSFAEGGTRVRRSAVRAALEGANVVVVLGEAWERWLRGFAAPKCVVVCPNPVEVPDEPASPVQPPLVIFSGRLGRRKGVPELLEAIETLQSEAVEARWALLGDGDVDETRGRVARLPDPSMVAVTGWVSGPDVTAWLAEASVFCLPSRAEGLPLSLLEGMAHGLACVATPVGGIPDLIRDGVDGLLVEPGDGAALTAALRRLLLDEGLRVSLGAAARLRVMERHSPERVADVLDGVYRAAGSVPATSG